MKKIMLSMGSLAAIAAPTAAVVSCGSRMCPRCKRYTSKLLRFYNPSFHKPDSCNRCVDGHEYSMGMWKEVE